MADYEIFSLIKEFMISDRCDPAFAAVHEASAEISRMVKKLARVFRSSSMARSFYKP